MEYEENGCSPNYDKDGHDWELVREKLSTDNYNKDGVIYKCSKCGREYLQWK